MEKWEYQWASVDPSRAQASLEILDKMGVEGWEAMAMVPVPRSDNQLVLLKRQTAPPQP